jgi:6-phosphogluconolactonase
MMRNAVRTLVVNCLVALAPCLTGCGAFFVNSTTTSTTAGTSFAYVANATTDTVAGYALASGALVAVASSPYTIGISPNSIVVTPANTFLYVGGLGAIYGYSIGSAGALTALSSGAALATASAVSLDVSPNGEWLLALDSSGVAVDEYQINTSTGALTAATGATISVTGTGSTAPRMVKFAPSGAYVFAAMGTGGDAVFTFNQSTGALAQAQSLAGASATSDNGLTVDANSAYLYIARSGTGSGVAAYSIGNGGALSTVAGSPFAAGAGPYSVVLDLTGTYLYAANRTDGTVSGYTVASGVLTALSGSPYASGSLVTALGRDALGKYVVAAAEGGSSDLTMYSFDAITPGKLDAVSVTATGTDPTGALAVALTHTSAGL